MNILIDTIRIAGFRGIKNLEMSLPRVTLLIGMNNSGKTSVLKALQLALGDYSRYLSEEDFYIGSDDKRADEIVVDVKIVPVDEQGDRIDTFDDDWQREFEDRIQSDANSRQYVALRTRSKLDKGGFDTSYSVLRVWTDGNNWLNAQVEIPNKKFLRLNGIQFIPIDAQRDIHQEIGEKSSLVRKVLSNIKYSKTEVDALEAMINELNDQAISKSNELATLKTNLENLNQSFESSGKAEITPFPRKIRDLSKYFSAHFGEDASSTFSMEYHGMGTRSWASMLIVNAFAELKKKEYEEEENLFFPILAAEEPEAHLHPNAQKTLYQQLEKFEGQVIISTHSPYVAAMAKQTELRYLKRTPDGITVRHLNPDLDQEERRRLQREVIHSRGEILFSKALVLSEGETEEQALPLLFKEYCGSEAFVKGVSFIGVGGKGIKYLPFLKFAKDFDIPVFIFSDGETEAVDQLKKTYDKVHGETDILVASNITILDSEDFEGYLVSCGCTEIIKYVICQQEGDDAIEVWIRKNQGQNDKKNKPPKDYTGIDGHEKALKEILDKGKVKYAPLIAEKLCKLEKEKLPPKILEFFQKLENGGII
ncbi:MULTISPECIES: ATP-dependent nuclease [Pseudanabaena]|uniref:ATP-dependent nuclease n=1 Tax=Pseudanabaena TaxID=1152 RepID=UPI00247A75D9|nr:MULTISPECIES: AAA family ATPase [Pseudanabaena]MEA5488801.1 AAA family ATPase [Pseudanabaena sp. CCNP1317]WGS71243.1 AAA family ATPase [Pseudanabaena galeata CCNP1313]